MTPSCKAVVVAHPDDEALWLSSVVTSADRVVFAFGDVFNEPQKSEARRRAVAALPLKACVHFYVPSVRRTQHATILRS